MLEMHLNIINSSPLYLSSFVYRALKMLENHSKALKCTCILLFLQDLALLQLLWGLNPQMGRECLALREIS